MNDIEFFALHEDDPQVPMSDKEVSSCHLVLLKDWSHREVVCVIYHLISIILKCIKLSKLQIY